MNYQENQIVELMLNNRLPIETQKEKELILSISKKVYTKLKLANKLPEDVLSEMSLMIKKREYFYLSTTFSKEMIKILIKFC